MPKAIKVALLTVGLCAGVALTAFSAALGWTTLNPPCHRRAVALTQAKQQVVAARSAVQAFVADWGRCPAGVYELVTAGHLERIGRDPWRQELFFSCGAGGGGDVVISVVSAGPDRVFGSADDIKV